MPWTKLENVPAQVKTHKGVKTTLAQANHWARIFDNLKTNSQLRNPAGAAWAAWENVYKLKEGKWIRSQTASKELVEPAEYSEVKQKLILSLLEKHKSDGDEQLYAVFKKSVEEDDRPDWYLNDTRIIEDTSADYLAEHELYEGEWALFPVTLDFAKDMYSIRGGRLAELPDGGIRIEIEEVVTTNVQSDDKHKKTKPWMESVVMLVENHGVKVIGDSPDGNPLIHGVAVTTNVSNNHRFPIDVLDAGINTLIGQPLVEGHSGWPDDDVKTSDTFGMIVDAWVNREAKHAEFIAEVWDDKYKKVVDKMSHRAKYSVGFRHNYEMDEDIKVSTGVSFDHLGATNRPADPDSILLGIKKDAEARGHKVSMEGKAISVVNLSGDNKANGGTGMTPDEKKLEEKRVADCKALLEKANITDEDKKTLEESITKTVPTVEEFTESVKEATDKKTEAEDIAAKKATKEKSPETKPPAPEEKKTETEEAGKDALVGEVKALQTSLEAETKKRQELESIVTKMQAEAKQKEVEGYVDSLIDAQIKQPAQRDDLVGLYMTFNDAQMQKEIELNSNALKYQFGGSGFKEAQVHFEHTEGK